MKTATRPRRLRRFLITEIRTLVEYMGPPSRQLLSAGVGAQPLPLYVQIEAKRGHALTSGDGGDLEQWRHGVKAFETLSVLLSTDAMLAGEEPTEVRVACSAGVDVPQLQDVALNTTVLMFSAAVCIVVALLVSAAPAIAPPVNIDRQLRAMAGSILSSARVRQWHTVLVVSELACALVPLTGAGLMVRSLSQVQSEGAILRPHEVLVGRIQPGPEEAAVSRED